MSALSSTHAAPRRGRYLRSPYKSAAGATFVRPFIKWAGGKTQLLSNFQALYPQGRAVQRYLEPFLGGGAVFFHVKAMLDPATAVLWDNNVELIETFLAVRDEVDELVRLLRGHRQKHNAEHYYRIREEQPEARAARAARLIYLNKTCFNGLYRVNSKGVFNVPLGSYQDPKILDEPALRAASRHLQGVELHTHDFRDLLKVARKGDFVYFDPPYHPRSKTASFTSYTTGSFGEQDQQDLADVYRQLDRRGCLLMLSNSDTELIGKLYSSFEIHRLSARRAINSNVEKRGRVSEVVVLNYQPPSPAAEAGPRMARIYTRKGDHGQTVLGNGQRVRKDEQRLECLGTIDEVSACIGLARTLLEQSPAPEGAAPLAEVLRKIQSELSALEADLAHPATGETVTPARIGASQVEALERGIDEWSRKLPPMREFILPGGGLVAAQLHQARTVCRRAERALVRLAASETVTEQALPYLNRLSDALFVAARHATRLYGNEDVPVTPI